LNRSGRVQTDRLVRSVRGIGYSSVRAVVKGRRRIDGELALTADLIVVFVFTSKEESNVDRTKCNS
jgi:hypothetical protein